MLLNSMYNTYIDEKMVSYARLINLQDRNIPKIILEITFINKDCLQVHYNSKSDLIEDLKKLNEVKENE